MTTKAANPGDGEAPLDLSAELAQALSNAEFFLVYQPTSAGLASTSRVASLASLAVKHSTPIHLSIPAIGVSVQLTELGLKRNGSPQVPSSWYVPG
jgi:hypothetical protein